MEKNCLRDKLSGVKRFGVKLSYKLISIGGKIQRHVVNGPTLRCKNVFTSKVFSTKTQDFTPTFLKPVVEVHLFLKGSKYGKDSNSENPSFMHLHPETTVVQLLKVL